MRTLLILILLATFALSKESSPCYSVTLLNLANTQDNLKLLSARKYPPTCKLQKKRKILTVTCKCLSDLSTAKKALKQYKKRYKNAFITTTTIAQVDQSDEELKLALNAFLYKNDVKNAYKVAKIAYKKYPNSYFWNEQLAKLAFYNDKGTEALQYLIFMYQHSHNTKIRDRIIRYGISDYQYKLVEKYVIEQAKEDPTNKNINTLVYVFDQVGEPGKAAETLVDAYKRDPKQTIFLTKALQIYLNMGALTRAKSLIAIMEDKKLYTPENSSQIAYYYYLLRKPATAYKYLLLAQNQATANDISYYQLMSDLGWYEQDYIAAAKASKIVMEQKQARLVDYVRVSQVYKSSDPTLATTALEDAYRKYKLPWLFYSFANNAILLKWYEKLQTVMVQVGDKDTALTEDARYWLIKAEVDFHFQRIAAGKEALDKARQLSHNDLEVQSALIAFYMNNHLDRRLENFLQKLSEQKDLSFGYYMPLASAYFYLHNVDRAVFYMQKLYKMHSPVTKSIAFRFLQASIYQAQSQRGGFYKEMRAIMKTLQKEARKDPTIATTDAFNNNYLNAAIYLQEADRFASNLKKRKKYLTKSNYDSLAYSWAIINNADEKSRDIFHKTLAKELWMQFSNATLFDDHTRIENMLHSRLTSLSFLDASNAADKDGQLMLARTLAYNALDKDSGSRDAYIQHLGLTRDQAGRFDAKFAYYNREPLIRTYTQLTDQTYLDRGWYLLTNFSYFQNSLLNEDTYYNIPSSTTEVGIGVKKLFQRGYVTLHVKNHNAVKNYNSVALFASYQATSRLLVNAGYANNKTADESIALLLSGKKESYNLELRYNILNSTAIDLYYEINHYTSDDNVGLGDGKYLRIGVSRELRIGYPDMSVEAFYDNGTYTPTNGYAGVTQGIVRSNNDILPENFYDIGAAFHYGLINSTSYTRVWRPYFSVGSYYNSQSGNLNYEVSGGYGGMIFHQDHLVIGASYSQGFNALSGNIFELFLKYRFLHTKP